MYFRVNLNMAKPTLCCCFTCIVFIELNLTVAFLSTKHKTKLAPADLSVRLGDGGL